MRGGADAGMVCVCVVDVLHIISLSNAPIPLPNTALSLSLSQTTTRLCAVVPLRQLGGLNTSRFGLRSTEAGKKRRSSSSPLRLDTVLPVPLEASYISGFAAVVRAFASFTHVSGNSLLNIILSTPRLKLKILSLSFF